LKLHLRGLACFVREERWLVQRKLARRARLRGPPWVREIQRAGGDL